MADKNFDYEAVLDERHAQEDRLTALGFDVDGGVVNMSTGQWDIFVYEKVNGVESISHTLSSITDVDEFIANRGQA